MSHGPMVPASMLLRLRRELDTVYWVLALMLAQQHGEQPREAGPKPRQRNTFDWRKRQAGDRDDA